MKTRINKVVVVAVILIFILAACSSGEKEITTSTNWEIVKTMEPTHQINLSAFYNEKEAITVGQYGELHYSEDGGKTWPRAKNDSTSCLSVDYVNENLIWVGCEWHEVIVSKDAGKTWSEAGRVNALGVHSNIDFLDDTTGWVCSPRELFATKDGGKTWAEVKLPKNHKESGGIAAICLKSEAVGYVLTCDGTLLITKDGGASWTPKEIGIEKYKVVNLKKKPGFVQQAIAYADIAFTDELTGYIVFSGIVSGSGTKSFALKTEDGGETWAGEILAPLKDTTITEVHLTEDAKYLTLGNANNELFLLKNTDIE